ncbi:hypothetical protein STEG23_036169 [Scotinomys teguina]
MSTLTVPAPASAVTGSPVKKQRLLLPKETAPVVQGVEWNSSTVQQKEVTQSPSTSTIRLVTSSSGGGSGQQFWLCKHPGIHYQCPSAIVTASANVTADIAEYTSKMMDAIKGTMTEIYNDVCKNTTGRAIAEIRRLRIEIEKLQWLHQQELA